jgi:hypothetical protein
MNKEHFKNLLEDLYEKYNHAKLSEVESIVESGNGREFDVIKKFYFKHNFSSHPNYDINAGSDIWVENLIDKYSNGFRVIKDKPSTTEEIPQPDIKKELELWFDDKQKQLEDIITQFKQSLSEIKPIGPIEPIIDSGKGHIELQINYDNGNISEISLPPDIDTYSVGTRFLVNGPDNRLMAFKIEEIVMDYISVPDKCLKEIHIIKI